MFKSVNQEVQSGLEITEETESSFKHIYDMTNEIAGKLQTMNAAVEHLSTGSHEISDAVEEIADVSRERLCRHSGHRRFSGRTAGFHGRNQAHPLQRSNRWLKSLRDLTKKFKI